MPSQNEIGTTGNRDVTYRLVRERQPFLSPQVLGLASPVAT